MPVFERPGVLASSPRSDGVDRRSIAFDAID
jgi:hypothetical protein